MPVDLNSRPAAHGARTRGQAGRLDSVPTAGKDVTMCVLMIESCML